MTIRAAHLFTLLALTSCHPTVTIKFTPLRCGVERWAVKTLTDPVAGQVTYVAVPTTIQYLRSLSAPPVLPNTRLTAERATYTVSGILQAWKLESDQDLHLVLADAQGRTMIAEVPNPVCMKASRAIPQVRLARAAVIAALGQPNSLHFVTVHRTVTVTGVLFFDFKHGQRGVAPNAVELHPVTHIVFGGP